MSVRNIAMRVGYYMIPVLQTVAASVAVIYVMRGIDRLLDRR